MTPRDLTYAALTHIRPSGGGTDEATITLASTKQLAHIAADLTATMQEIYWQAPLIFRRRVGVTLAAPSTITLNCTNGSDVVTTSDSFTEGATVNVGGVFNEIYTENSQKKLVYPWTGATGAQSATLYYDVVVLGSTVSGVAGNVFLADSNRLRKAVNRQDFLGGLREYPDYGRRLRLQTSRPTVGVPQKYWVEPFLLTAASAGHQSTLRLRVMPLPSAIQQLSYEAKLRAPTYAVADLGTDGADSTKTLVVPDQYHESIVRPIFLEKWSGSPWFRDESARTKIAEDAKAAWALVREYRPQQESNRRIVATL